MSYIINLAENKTIENQLPHYDQYYSLFPTLHLYIEDIQDAEPECEAEDYEDCCGNELAEYPLYQKALKILEDKAHIKITDTEIPPALSIENQEQIVKQIDQYKAERGKRIKKMLEERGEYSIQALASVLSCEESEEAKLLFLYKGELYTLEEFADLLKNRLKKPLYITEILKVEEVNISERLENCCYAV